jgi:hypothetical protein
MSNFRGGANKPSGRWFRAELDYAVDFTVISGAEFDFTVTGKV